SSSSRARRQESLTNWIVRPILQDKQKFLNKLALNYKLLSADLLRTNIFNNLFSTYLDKKLKSMISLMNITIALNGWQNISKNSIYGFIALKENKKNVLDIVDLLSNWHQKYLENASIDIFFEEFDEDEILQIDVELLNLDMNNTDLAMEEFFDTKTFKEQNAIKDFYSQENTNLNEDWLIKDIFRFNSQI
ncbi:2960_t:CDS:2, partial [Dentiscutata heterogama]